MDVLAALFGVGVLLLVAAVPVGLFFSRQSTLSRRVGSFSCQLRAAPQEAWTAGIAQYGASRLIWWRTLSLAPRPAQTWSRSTLQLLERVNLDQKDEQGREQVMVRCAHGPDRFEVLLSEQACAGLVSWLESGPRPVGRGL